MTIVCRAALSVRAEVIQVRWQGRLLVLFALSAGGLGTLRPGILPTCLQSDGRDLQGGGGGGDS